MVELPTVRSCSGRWTTGTLSVFTLTELEFVYEIEGHSVSIYEVRPDWKDSSKKTKMGVARFRYTRSRGEWRLYWMRRDLKWHLYDPDVSISRQLEPLVQVVASDRFGAFFG